MNKTKEKILLTALRLFATRGYEATSVSDIAKDLGVTKGALYKHYKSKRDVFDKIIAHMAQRDVEEAKRFDLPTGTLEEMKDAYRAATINRVVKFGRAMFRYWTQDEFAASFRKMLMLEQFHNPEMSALYQQYLVSGPIGYTTDLFASLGVSEPERKAIEFYAPMFLLYSVYDGAEDHDQALAMLDECMANARQKLSEETLK